MNENIVLTTDDIREIFAALADISDGANFGLISDVRSTPRGTAETRKLYAELELHSKKIADAVILGSFMQKLVVNLYKSLYKKSGSPLRYFTDVQPAMAWLEEQIKISGHRHDGPSFMAC